ncbi:MAG: GntR family transcriptional regulator [Acidimicrobiales bacterium]
MRELRYRAIADELRRRVEAGDFGAGRLLPSEASLSEEYGSSRITVRRALELLRSEGLVDARQGFGWFVATDPFRQALGRLGTIEAQLAAAGVSSERRVVDFRFVRAPARVREVLGVDSVLEVRRVNYTLGPGGRQPFARITVWCPSPLGAKLSRDDVERSSFYELLPVTLGGATQTIAAGVASADDAELLEVPPGSPVLVCERITRSSEAIPVLLSVHVFPAHLTEFVVDLPKVEASMSMAPSGLRLVAGESS